MSDVIEFKSSQLALTLVRVHDSNMNEISKALESKLTKVAKFLQGAPVVVDPACVLNSVQLAQLLELLRQNLMTPVGVRTQDPSLVDYAQLCGLAVFKPNTAKATNKSSESPEDTNDSAVDYKSAPAAAPALEEKRGLTSAIRLAGLRSGQLERFMLNDVIISGGVNSGAEIYAGGHVTIMGSTRGRVHAGATGKLDARIIARDFNPELVSISGVFLLSDDIPSLAKRGWVEVYLENQSLKFRSIDS